MSVFGHVDQIGVSVHGWALDFDHLEESCALDVIINGRRRATVLTGAHPRPDVAEAMASGHQKHIPEQGAYGFEVNIGSWLAPGENSVEIRYNKTGLSVANGVGCVVRAPLDCVDACEGLDNYLFPVDRTYALYDKLAGVIKLDSGTMDLAVKSMISADWCLAAKQIAFDVSICPDRTIFIRDRVGGMNENVPLHISDDRSSQQLIKVGQRYGFNIRYDIDALAGWDVERVARRVDTHLTLRACHALARRVLGRIATPSDLAAFDAFYSWETRDVPGDLSVFVPGEWLESLDHEVPAQPVQSLFDTKRAKIVWDLVGHAAVQYNPAAPMEMIVVFGTSSSIFVSRFFSSVYRLVINVWGHGIDWQLIEQLRPTAVAVILTERLLGGRLFSWDIECRSDARRKIQVAASALAQGASETT